MSAFHKFDERERESQRETETDSKKTRVKARTSQKEQIFKGIAGTAVRRVTGGGGIGRNAGF